MKNKLFYFIPLILITLFCFGCSDKNAPKTAFDTYINAWNSKNYNGMYSLLSTDSKNSISKEDFIAKYKNIYSGIELSKLTITPNYPKSFTPDSDGKLSIPFDVTMVTAAGKISFSDTAYLKKETINDKDAWTIIWSNKMIFKDLGNDQKIRVNKTAGKRGEIKDSDGNYLAQNGAISEVGIVPGKLSSDKTTAVNQIAQILKTTADSVNKKLSASYVKDDTFVPISDISKDDSDRKTALLRIPGVKIIDKEARVYPLKEKAAQLTGYVQEVTAEDITKNKDQGYSEGDIIGKAGLEKIYEKALRAQSGAEIYIVDKNGDRIKTIAKTSPKNGTDIKLTIKSNIQTSVYNELKDDAGCGVVLDPKTGAVLALVSTPSYDPNQFVLGISADDWNALNNNPKKPLTNRFQSTFAPGSTFKPITTAIGLKTNKLNADAVKNISGLKWQKDSSWGAYYVTRDEAYSEPANLLNALVHSDNIYFAQTALDIGKDTFTSEAKNFGIGENIPFEYGLYSSQLASSDGIKNDTQLADSGYGQAEVMMNPVQLAAIYTSFVNNGNIITPYLKADNSSPSKVWKSNVFSSDIASTILNDLTQVVANTEGTGHSAYNSAIPIAGKTGTAEIKKSQTDTTGTENGWFVGVNTNNPKLLVLEMVEDVKNRGGSHYVVPKVGDIFNQYCK